MLTQVAGGLTDKGVVIVLNNSFCNGAQYRSVTVCNHAQYRFAMLLNDGS
jgi:hypothetical protein